MTPRAAAGAAGSFYACEAFRRLALADSHALRLGVAPYTDASEVARVLEGLAAFLG